MNRLTIDITEKQHQTLKATAALEGKTMREYALERLFPAADDEEMAWQALKSVVASRIQEARTVGSSVHTMEEILAEELASANPA